MFQELWSLFQYLAKHRLKINYKKGIAESFKFQGTANYLLGNFKNAENYYSKALVVNQEIDNKIGIMSCLSNLGSVNNVQNKYAIALQYYQKAIRIGEILKEEKNTSNTYVNMGIIYSLHQNNLMEINLYNI